MTDYSFYVLNMTFCLKEQCSFKKTTTWEMTTWGTWMGQFCFSFVHGLSWFIILRLWLYAFFSFLNGQMRLNFSFTNAPHIYHFLCQPWFETLIEVWRIIVHPVQLYGPTCFDCVLVIVLNCLLACCLQFIIYWFQLFFGQSCNAMSYFLFPHCDEHYIISIRVLIFQFFSAERGTCRYQQS